MPNRYFNDRAMNKPGKGHAPALKTGGGMAFNEKPAFPSASLPGKSGPDRSAGVKKVKVDPKRIGL